MIYDFNVEKRKQDKPRQPGKNFRKESSIKKGIQKSLK
jgi:hypothetical protein